jgi:holo-[acyl-carrier protein] synthase
LLHGGVREYADQLGLDSVLLTISHCRAYATATAIGWGGSSPA